MAEIDFPNNAVDGQQFLTGGTVFTYNAAKNLWLGVATAAAEDAASGASTLAELTDVALGGLLTGQVIYYNGISWTNTNVRIDDIYLPASQRYEVTTSGSIYKINQIDPALDNPSIIVQSGTTIAFRLSTGGHPFKIQNDNGVDYNTGLVHVSSEGIVSTEADAQSKTTGTLYWQIPYTLTGEFSYQCAIHGSQEGKIVVKGISGTEGLGNYTINAGSLTLDLATSNVFNITLSQNIVNFLLENLPPANIAAAYTLIITNQGNFDISWGSAVEWPEGTPPILTASGKDVITLLTTDGGTTFYGFTAGQNFSETV